MILLLIIIYCSMDVFAQCEIRANRQKLKKYTRRRALCSLFLFLLFFLLRLFSSLQTHIGRRSFELRLTRHIYIVENTSKTSLKAQAFAWQYTGTHPQLVYTYICAYIFIKQIYIDYFFMILL